MGRGQNSVPTGPSTALSSDTLSRTVKFFGWDDGDCDPLQHFFAPWDKFSDRTRGIVVDNAVIIANRLNQLGDWGITNCTAACELWCDVFADNGVKAELNHGDYDPDYDPDTLSSSSEHVWLTVEGYIFDPTAGQFEGTIIQSNYHLTEPDLPIN